MQWFVGQDFPVQVDDVVGVEALLEHGIVRLDVPDAHLFPLLSQGTRLVIEGTNLTVQDYRFHGGIQRFLKADQEKGRRCVSNEIQ